MINEKIDPHKIFKRFASDNEAERMVAANKLYESFKAGGHPDDWELFKKGTAPKPKSTLAEVEAAMSKADAEFARMERQFEEDRRKKAEAATEKERKARAKAEAETAKLREQLDEARKAKAAPDPSVRVDLLSGLLSQETLDKLTPEQIGEKIESLYADRETREHNTAAQVDLVIGQLTEALYRLHAKLFGKRKRGDSNVPTVSEFLETHAGRSASWCRRCFKANGIVTADGWDESSWDGTGGIEGIIKSATDPNRPKVKRVSKVQQRLDALTDVVRKREWQNAAEMVNVWDFT